MGITCGIPSVTLEGEQIDYIKILDRLDRLEEFGEEPKMWAAMLRPILRRFISAFDGEPDQAFWDNVVYRDDSVCGIDYLTGWITAFSVWTASGKWQAPKVVMPEQGSVVEKSLSESNFGLLRHLTYLDPGTSGPSYRKLLTIDGITYPGFEFEDITEGYGQVDVRFIDGGLVYNCAMIAGHVATKVTSKEEGGPPDTLSPAPQWFMYMKKNSRQISIKYSKWVGMDAPKLRSPSPIASAKSSKAGKAVQSKSAVGCSSTPTALTSTSKLSTSKIFISDFSTKLRSMMKFKN